MAIGPRFILTSLAALLTVAATPSYGLEFPTTSDRGAPSRGPALATRGDICLDPKLKPSLTSLVPQNAIATSLGTDPTIPLALWFYIPETRATAAELVVFNEFGEDLYDHIVSLDPQSLAETGGVISIALPTQENALTFTDDQPHYWEFSLICDPQDRNEDVIVGGALQQLAPDPALLSQLAAVDADDLLGQAELYAAAGAWQETIALAAALRPQSPEVWNQLLVSVGLETIGAASLGKRPVSVAETTTPAASSQRAVETQPTLSELLEGVLDRSRQ